VLHICAFDPAMARIEAIEILDLFIYEALHGSP
jgi:hypothetical protein